MGHFLLECVLHLVGYVVLDCVTPCHLFGIFLLEWFLFCFLLLLLPIFSLSLFFFFFFFFFFFQYILCTSDGVWGGGGGGGIINVCMCLRDWGWVAGVLFEVWKKKGICKILYTDILELSCEYTSFNVHECVSICACIGCICEI